MGVAGEDSIRGEDFVINTRYWAALNVAQRRPARYLVSIINKHSQIGNISKITHTASYSLLFFSDDAAIRF